MAPRVELSSNLIQIHPGDNIASLTRSIEAGSELKIGAETTTTDEVLGLGHKIAIQPIGKGEKVIKWGAPIGSATESIPPGAHVHLHNMKSDYLPTYTLEAGNKYAQ